MGQDLDVYPVQLVALESLGKQSLCGFHACTVVGNVGECVVYHVVQVDVVGSDDIKVHLVVAAEPVVVDTMERQ